MIFVFLYYNKNIAYSHINVNCFITNHFKVILRKNKLRDIRFHELRHSCASLLLAKGIPMKMIQDCSDTRICRLRRIFIAISIVRVKRRLHRRLESCWGEGKDRERATVAVAFVRYGV